MIRAIPIPLFRFTPLAPRAIGPLLAIFLLPVAFPAIGPRALGATGAPSPSTSGIIPEHGKYSAAYMGDWSTLPTADKLPRPPLPALPASVDTTGDTGNAVPDSALRIVKGEAIRRQWLHQEKVRLSDLRLAVTWDPTPSHKDHTTLFHIADAGEVVIENLTIIQADPDYRGYHTILVEGADRVIVRNVQLAGSVQSFHLRIEGCRDVFIDNLEISGIDYHRRGRFRAGGGLWLNNGNTGRLGHNGTGLWTEYARMPGWQVIQNSYFHDGTESDGGEWRNQDAVLIHHPGHGVLFNNVVENWFHPPMDGGFDIGFRRAEPEYQDRFFRVERNILRNVTFIKTPAAAPGPNTLFYANNLFINTQLADYHKGAANDVHYVHNTCIYDLAKAPVPFRELARRGASGYASLWNYGAPTHLANSLLYRPAPSPADASPFTVYYANKDAAPDKYLHFKSAFNTWALSLSNLTWLRTARDGARYKTLDDWRRATDSDTGSALVDPGAIHFANYAADDYRLLQNPASGNSSAFPGPATTTRYLDPSDKRMQVNRDFYGQLRSQDPTSPTAAPAPGAFNVEPAAARP
ncbi:hypothetical protein OPIT5_08005 [Opitutaceae bacterium TAV5]|nr:hypothetical protein OPIT5_08005 [Opitutaceae bacterium TAV5]